MATGRTARYFEAKAKRKGGPIQHKEDIAAHTDNKIDQDFPGYPHAPAKPELIKPVTDEEKKTAAVNVTDGEKQFNEQDSDGSGGAFTEAEK